MGRVAVVTQPTAQHSIRGRRRPWRPKRKLLRDSERFDLVSHMLRGHLSPEQIADKLLSMNMPSLKDAYVCRETIDNAIYALPKGGLRKELILCLYQGKTTRMLRSGGGFDEGQGQRLVCRHLGGAHQWLLDAGKNERCNRDVRHAGLQCCTQSYAAAMRKSMTYDQDGRWPSMPTSPKTLRLLSIFADEAIDVAPRHARRRASSVLVVPDSSSAFHRATLAAVRAGRCKCTSSACGCM